MSYLLQTALAVAQLVLGFYGVWLVWRVLLAELPDPRDPEERIAPFAGYFTDPLVRPLARGLHIHPRLVSALILFVVGAGQVALDCSGARWRVPGRLTRHLQKLRQNFRLFVPPGRRRHRTYPRAVKLKMSPYPRKRPSAPSLRDRH